MLQVGQKVFYFDPKYKEVRESQIVGINIGTTGYALVSMLGDDNKKFHLEEAHVFGDKESATTHAIMVTPIILEAESTLDKAKEAVDSLRIQVIGEPAYKELADIITKG